MFTPIPFTLNIVTTTKPMVHTVKDMMGATFPSPPITAQGVELRLIRKVFLQAEEWQADSSEIVTKLGGLGPRVGPTDSDDTATVEVMEKTWIPDSGDEKGRRGAWRQETVFKSSFMLTCPPSFESSIMSVAVCILTCS